MKVGIMGGTFNPIHIGHLLLGQYAYELYDLDEIWFMPNGNPPHKEVIHWENDVQDRIRMVELAIEGISYFKMNLHEAGTEEHSYTYRTLQEFRKLYPEHEFYFIIGADSLFALEQWMCYEQIFPNCIFLAAIRDDRDETDVLRQISYFEVQYQAQIRLLRTPLIEISSTEIRERVCKSKSVRYMVPDKVMNYIRDKHLYEG